MHDRTVGGSRWGSHVVAAAQIEIVGCMASLGAGHPAISDPIGYLRRFCYLVDAPRANSLCLRL